MGVEVDVDVDDDVEVDVLVEEDVVELLVVVLLLLVVVDANVVVVDVELVDVDATLLVPAGGSDVGEGELLGASHPIATRTTAMVGSVASRANWFATRESRPTRAVCQRPTSSGRFVPSDR